MSRKENLVLQIERGNLVKDEEKRVLRNHDRTGEPVEASWYKVQEVGHLKHRD